ncbi:Rieske (2Fe-2S) protein [Rufibacter roseus]|uniref:Rieske (2Fe-2S) protein n=1 Tax=Rufibacter roseus TaxID=1567108 RepID=A0ABW2DNG9_9BACT|nr:Rieske 2Fe-2S domain-containing protein [Rufibacter roseus]
MGWIKIFESEAAAKQQIPLTKATALVVNGQEICIAHTSAGLFAVKNACPHLGDSLSRGTTNYLNEIVCPWHSYRFHLATGEECQGRTKPLQRYPLEAREDGLFLMTNE